LTTLIGHLRHQQNLIREMRSTRPKVADTAGYQWDAQQPGFVPKEIGF
jgi:hypothetical protein